MYIIKISIIIFKFNAIKSHLWWILHTCQMSSDIIHFPQQCHNLCYDPTSSPENDSINTFSSFTAYFPFFYLYLVYITTFWTKDLQDFVSELSFLNYRHNYWIYHSQKLNSNCSLGFSCNCNHCICLFPSIQPKYFARLSVNVNYDIHFPCFLVSVIKLFLCRVNSI